MAGYKTTKQLLAEYHRREKRWDNMTPKQKKKFDPLKYEVDKSSARARKQRVWNKEGTVGTWPKKTKPKRKKQTVYKQFTTGKKKPDVITEFWK